MVAKTPFELLSRSLEPQESLNIPDREIARQRLLELWDLLDSRARNRIAATPKFISALLHALGLSPFIHHTLMRHPGFLGTLALSTLSSSPSRHALAISLGKQVATAQSQEAFSKGIRVFRLYHTIRIALRELGGLGSVQDTMKEMSNLADVVVEACLKYTWKTLTERHGIPTIRKRGRKIRSHFSVIDLGKLGGEELNFSSDIDILYVFDSEKGETSAREEDSLPNAVFYRKLSEMLTRLVSEKTSYGFGFRVDLGLRPDGQYGDIANSLRSMEIYYESWGKLWERAVWIKARHGAGHSPLSQTLLDILRPFVYRKYLDFTAIEEIREMKQKIDQENRFHRKGEDNIKLGWGGIREIEFFTQALQLIHGGKLPLLQCRNTLLSLQRLGKARLIPERDIQVLVDAYLFLRRLEHRIQLIHQRQTQQLPASRDEQVRIAKSLFPGSDDSSLARLKDTLSRYREEVHQIYENLFYAPSQKTTSAVSQEIQSIFSGNVPSEIAIEWLGENGFAYPERALEIIERLRKGPPSAHYVPKTLNLLNRLLPSLLQAVSSSPDPDMALGYLLSFVEKIGARGSFYALLLENPPILKLLAKVFGSSRFLSNHLIQHLELLDELLNPSHHDIIKTRRQMEETLAALLLKGGDLETRMDQLRRFKHSEVLRIGINDIYGGMEITEVTRQLSEVAEVCLTASYQIAREVQNQRFNLAKDWNPPFVILGMGKLGGKELNYSSDLDLIFLFDGAHHGGLPESVDPNEFYSKLAQRFITIMTSPTVEGTLYEIDTRLRPSGTFGPIVTSLESFKIYHAHSAWFWERQALVKARPIAGNLSLYESISNALEEIVYQKPITPKEKREILDMRAQMEKEIGKESPQRLHIKCGRGGLVDIEFLVQYYQIKEGEKHPELRNPNTLEVLRRMEKSKILPSPVAQELKEAYLFLRRLENRIQILENRSFPFFNPTGQELARLARRMGYVKKEGLTAAERFYQDYIAKTRRVRDIFVQWLGPLET